MHCFLCEWDSRNLHSHLDFFSENLGVVSEEQGERFQEDIKDVERRYQGRWDVLMLADYCWLLTRDDMAVPHNRKVSQSCLQIQLDENSPTYE